MKKILILSLLALAGLSLTAAPGKSDKPGKPLRTTADSLAYYAGANLTMYVKMIDSTLSINTLVVGLEDAMAGNEAAEASRAFAFLNDYMTVRLPLIKLAESEAFLARIERQAGVRKTESGLLYRIDSQGDMSSVATSDADQVRVVYHGTLPGGKVFDSSRERGDTVSFPLNQVIRGWTEGMKLVGKGGRITLWIHPEMAYGSNGGGGTIGPNQALVFEVELIDVIPYVAEVYDEPSEDETDDYEGSDDEYVEEEIEQYEYYSREMDRAYGQGYNEGYAAGIADATGSTQE